MNRPDFSELVVAFKGGSSKNAGFQSAKPGNFDGAHDRKLWMLGLQKWRITYMLRRLDNIRLWSLPNPTWKAMLPHGGRQWDKRKGRTMVILGNSLRNTSKPNLFQGILTRFQGANSKTLWMPQMTTYNNMWRFIPNSCLRSSTCMSWIVCANLWWGFQLGPSVSLRKIGHLPYPKPSWKWKASRMWDGWKIQV